MKQTDKKKTISVMEDVWMTRKTLEEANTKLKSSAINNRQDNDSEFKFQLNRMFLICFGCYISMVALSLIFASITWISETCNIDEVPIVINYVTVILLFILLFS